MSTTYYQYRITANGTTGPVLDDHPGAQWDWVLTSAIERGYDARFERRLVTTPDLLDWLTDATGYIRIRDMLVCPWEIMAEKRGDIPAAIIIGGLA